MTLRTGTNVNKSDNKNDTTAGCCGSIKNNYTREYNISSSLVYGLVGVIRAICAVRIIVGLFLGLLLGLFRLPLMELECGALQLGKYFNLVSYLLLANSRVV